MLFEKMNYFIDILSEQKSKIIKTSEDKDIEAKNIIHENEHLKEKLHAFINNKEKYINKANKNLNVLKRRERE